MTVYHLKTGPSPHIKSGPAKDRASAEGTSGREYKRGMPLLVRGVRGISPEKILIYGCLCVRFLCILDVS